MKKFTESSEDDSNEPLLRNKRTLSAASLPSSPALSPRHLFTLTKPKIDEDAAFGELLMELRQAEYSLLFAHRNYNSRLEVPKSYLVRLINSDFYDNIHTRACDLVNPTLPSLAKITQSMQQISAAFGVGELVAKPRTYKHAVKKMADLVWSLMSKTTLKIFDYQPTKLALSEQDLDAFLNELHAIQDFDAQKDFLMQKAHLDASLQACNQSENLYGFCLQEQLEKDWQNCVKYLHPEVKEFLYDHYCSEEYGNLNNVMSFEIILWAYEFHADLSLIYHILNQILQTELPLKPVDDLAEALRYLIDTRHATREKERDFPFRLRYIQELHQEQQTTFFAQKEIEQRATSDTLQSHIFKKPFALLMRNLFHNYIKLHKNFYLFVNCHKLAQSEKKVIANLESLSVFGESNLRTNYRIAADYFRQSKENLDSIYAKYHQTLANFCRDLHEFEHIPCIKALGQAFYQSLQEFKPKNSLNLLSWFAEKYDENWLLHTLSKLDIDNQSLLPTKLLALYHDLQMTWQDCDKLAVKIKDALPKIGALQGEPTAADQLMQLGLIAMQEKFSSLLTSALSLKSRIYVENGPAQMTSNCILNKISTALHGIKPCHSSLVSLDTDI